MLLLLFGGSTSGIPAPPVTGKVLAVTLPDEVAAGVPATIYCEVVNSAGNFVLTASPQVSIWAVHSGVRVVVQPAAVMTQVVGGGAVWSYTWSVPPKGTFEVAIAAEITPDVYFAVVPITVRPQFDPIALAVDGILVSRM